MDFVLDVSKTAKGDLSALLGEEIFFKVVGLPENHEVTIHLHRADENNRLWYSQATYIANDQGVVENSSSKSISGNYEGVDAAGLFWSMELINENAILPERFTKLRGKKGDSIFLSLDIEYKGRIVGSESIEIIKKIPDVKMEPVQHGNIKANFFYQSNKEKLPVIIVVGGSEGGMETPDIAAGLLASYGYAAMSLAYFGVPGLPKILEEIPLDYLECAIEWIKEKEMVDKDKIIMMGTSKGAELTLLAASKFPIKAIIAVSPSCTVFQSLNTDPDALPKSSWTYQGNPLPFTPFIYTPEFTDQFSSGFPEHLEFLSLYSSSLKDKNAVEKASIKVENINGPILLVSSGEDRVWPSEIMCEKMVERLHKHNFPHNIQHVNYEKAGHMAGRPGYMPWPQPFYVKGGKPADNGKAQADIWRIILKFLKQNLG